MSILDFIKKPVAKTTETKSVLDFNLPDAPMTQASAMPVPRPVLGRNEVIQSAPPKSKVLEFISRKTPQVLKDAGTQFKEGLFGYEGPDLRGETRSKGGLLRRGEKDSGFMGFKTPLAKYNEAIEYAQSKGIPESRAVDIAAEVTGYGKKEPKILSGYTKEKRMQALNLSEAEKKTIKSLDTINWIDDTLSALDFVPIGPIEKVGVKVAEEIAKTTDKEAIKIILRKELPGIPEPAIDVFAQGLQHVDQADDVQRVLNKIDFQAKGGKEIAGQEKGVVPFTPAKHPLEKLSLPVEEMIAQSKKLTPAEGDISARLVAIADDLNKGAITETEAVKLIKAEQAKASPELLEKVSRATLTKKVPIYKGETDLSTTILKDLEGKSTVSKQYILDATNRGEIKQQERDLIREVLERETPKGTKVLHGSGVKFDSFDDSMRGSLTGAKSAKGAIWFTDDPATAKAYSVYSAEEGVVKKALDEADALEKIAQRSGKKADWAKYDAKVAESEKLATYENSFNRRKNANVKEAYIDGDLYEVDAKGKSPQELSEEGDIDSWLNAQIEKAKKLGKDGVKITNLDDAVGLYNRPATHYAIFDSKNIKLPSDTINVKEFAEKVKAELLPLDRETVVKDTMREGKPQLGGRYESVSLPVDVRGPIDKYSEHVYTSPVSTDAGDIHFSDVSLGEKTGKDTRNYFGHTRVEDLPTEGNYTNVRTGEKEGPVPGEPTRRVIEIQTDLYQKGGVEAHVPDAENLQSKLDYNKSHLKTLEESTKYSPKEKDDRISDTERTIRMVEKQISNIGKLKQYSNPTAHFRMVREEIKQAAIDGKTKLQFPTGETAMKIEGLGEINIWKEPRLSISSPVGRNLTASDLKIGKKISRNGSDEFWVITEVMDSGKFKAIDKTNFPSISENPKDWDELMKNDIKNHSEQFDISGKVDTNNPIYRFYEKDLGRYLKNKYGTEIVTDAQGVKWYEVNITPDMEGPVTAFKKNSLARYLDANKVSVEKMKKLIFEDIPEKDVRLIFDPNMTEQGLYKGIRPEMRGVLKPLITLYENKGKVRVFAGLHEAGHYVIDNFMTDAEKTASRELAWKEMTVADKAGYKFTGYSKEQYADEWIADQYAKAKMKEKGYTKGPMGKVFDILDRILKHISDTMAKIKAHFTEMTGKLKTEGERGFAKLPFMNDDLGDVHGGKVAQNIYRGKTNNEIIRELYQENAEAIENTTGKYSFDGPQQAVDFLRGEIGKERFSKVLNAPFKIEQLTIDHIFEGRTQKEAISRAKMAGPGLEIIEDTGLLVAIDKESDAVLGITYYDILGKDNSGENVLIRAKVSEKNKNGKVYFTVSDISGGTQVPATPSSSRSPVGFTTSETLADSVSPETLFVNQITDPIPKKPQNGTKSRELNANIKASIKLTKSQLDDIAGRIGTKDKSALNLQFAEDALDQNPLSEYEKYADMANGELPEVTGKDKHTPNGNRKLSRSKLNQNVFANKGDQMAEDLGYESSEDMRADFVKYLEQKDRVKQLRADQALLNKGKYLLMKASGERKKEFAMIKEAFNLTDNDLKKLRDGRNVIDMEDDEFADFMVQAEIQAGILERTREARAIVMGVIEDKQLRKVDNLRKALQLPKIENMNEDQLKEFDEILSQYQFGDIFLGQRKLETLPRTEYKDIRTYREAQEKFAEALTERVGREVKPEELSNIVGSMDKFKWDTLLADKSPVFQYLVEETNSIFLEAEGSIIEIEEQINKMMKRVNQGFINKLVPRNDRIINYLQASDKVEASKSLTKDEFLVARFAEEYYKKAHDYLVENKAFLQSRFENTYFTHSRRGFLEAFVDKEGKWYNPKSGFEKFKAGLRAILEKQKLEKVVIDILDQKTGEILPMDKFFKNALKREGDGNYSKNFAKVFMEYVRLLETKKALDHKIPEIMTFADLLTPQKFTRTGLVKNDKIKTFFQEYINNKKGRKAELLFSHGSGGDTVIKSLNAFVAMRDLGFHVIGQLASNVGQHFGTYAVMGPKNYVKGWWRYKATLIPEKYASQTVKKVKDILQESKAYTGRNPWSELVDISKDLGDKVHSTMFILYRDAVVRSNQIHLLGSLTKEEWEAGKISSQRLAELRLQLGRWLPVEKAESIYGSTSVGKAATKYKGWAIVMGDRAVRNIATVTKMIAQKKGKDIVKSRELKELVNISLITALAALSAWAAADWIDDLDDDSFLGKLKKKIIMESLSLFTALSPAFFFTLPRIGQFLLDISKALVEIAKIEKYKVSNKKDGYKKGDLKGVQHLQNILTPNMVNTIGNLLNFKPSKTKKSNSNLPSLVGKKKGSLPSLQGKKKELPSLKGKKKKLPSLLGK